MYKPEATFFADDEHASCDKDRTVFSQGCSLAFTRFTGPPCGPPLLLPAVVRLSRPHRLLKPRLHLPSLPTSPLPICPRFLLQPLSLGLSGKIQAVDGAHFKMLLFTEFQNLKQSLSHSQSSMSREETDGRIGLAFASPFSLRAGKHFPGQQTDPGKLTAQRASSWRKHHRPSPPRTPPASLPPVGSQQCLTYKPGSYSPL